LDNPAFGEDLAKLMLDRIEKTIEATPIEHIEKIAIRELFGSGALAFSSIAFYISKTKAL